MSLSVHAKLRRRARLLTLATGVGSLFAMRPANSLAGVDTWNVSSGGSWASNSNWLNGLIPQNLGDSADFFGAINNPSTVTLDGIWALGTISFSNSFSYTIATGSGGGLDLDSGGGVAALISTTAGNDAITAAMTAPDGLIVQVGTAAQTLTLSGSISGGGSSGLSLSGPGLLEILGATNSYSGGTSIAAGSTLFAFDRASLGSGAVSNAGTLVLLTSSTLSGNFAGNGALLAAGGTLTLNNSNGQISSALVGVTLGATMVLDFSHSNTAQEIVAGTTLNMAGGNLLIIPNATATTVQVFTTTTFTGAGPAGNGSIQSITALGTAGQTTLVLGSYDFGDGGKGFTSITKAANQFGNEVIFNGPLANQGTTQPISDFAVFQNTETAAALFTSAVNAGGQSGFGQGYYSGFALYGNSDWAVVTAPTNGTSYIVPGSSVSGFYIETSTLAPNTTSALYVSDGIAAYPFQAQVGTPATANLNYDIDSPGPAITKGNSTDASIRFNSPLGGFTTAGGNAMDQLLFASAALYEGTDYLMTPNVGATNLLFADLGQTASGASSAATQDMDLSRAAAVDVTFWNTDFQGNTAGIMIFATGMEDSKSGGAGVSLLGPGMFALCTTNAYTAVTSIEGGVVQIETNASLGGNSKTQAAVYLNGGTLVTQKSIVIDNSVYATGNLLARSVNVGALGGDLSAVGGATLTVDGAILGAGNLSIGMGTFTEVVENKATSTLALIAAAGNGSVILSGNAAAFSGTITVGNGASLQLDGSYNAATGVTVADGSTGSILSGSPASIVSSVDIGRGTTFYPGDNGTGAFTAANVALASGSTLVFGFSSTSDSLNITTANGLVLPNANLGGTELLRFLFAGTNQDFNTTGTYDLLNVFGSNNAFNINGTLGAGQVGPFELLNFPGEGTFALTTIAVGSNETELQLSIKGQTVPGWNNPNGGAWNNPSNWNPPSVPDGLGVLARFPTLGNAAGIVVTLPNGGETVGNLIFSATNSYTISGTGGLLFNNGTTNAPVSSSVYDQFGSHTIAAPMSVPGGVSVVVVNATDTMTLSGLIQNGTAGAATINSAGLQINGVNLQGSPIQQGSGTVILAGGAEAYTGGTSIFGGTLQLGDGTNGALIPSQGTAPMLLDGNLAFDEPAGTTVTFTNAANVASGTGGIVQMASGTLIVMSPAAANEPQNNPLTLAITAGELRQGNGVASTWGAVNVAGGATFDLNGFTTFLGSLAGEGLVENTVPGTSITLNAGSNGATATFSGVLSNVTGATLSFAKNGGGLMVLAGANTYGGSTLLNDGYLRLTSSASLPAGSTLTLGGGLGQNGPLILSNGVTLTNPITSFVNADELINLPDGTETALLSGPINVEPGEQYRMGFSNTKATLYVTNAETASNLTFFTGGNIVLLPGFSLMAMQTISAQAIGFGRSGTALNLTLDGNASITETASTGAQIGYTGNGGNNRHVTIVMNDTSSINLNSGAFELDGSGNNNGVINTLTLNGGTVNAGEFTFTPASQTAATAVVNFNGGVVMAGAASNNFLPSGTAGTLQLNIGAGGAKISTNGFNEIVASTDGFNGAASPVDGGFIKEGAGNLSFTGNFGSSGIGTPYYGPTVIVGGGFDYAGGALSPNNANMLANTAFIQVNAGGGAGVDDGSLSDAAFLSKMTAAPGAQGGALLLSASDAATNVDYTGSALGAFDMTHPGGSASSFTQMSLGAVADPGGHGTTGVPVIYTGTITPAASGNLANRYLLGGGGTLELTLSDALTGPNQLIAENGGAVWLTSTNNYTGGTIIQGMIVPANDITGATNLETTTLIVNVLGDADGNGSSIGNADNSAANLVVNGGSLRFIGSGGASNRLFTIGQLGATLDSSGSGALILQNPGNEAFAAGGGSYTLTLTGSEGLFVSAASVNVLAGALVPPAGSTLSIIKNGSGIWRISGGHFAGISVNSGFLQLANNSHTTNVSSISVTPGAALDIGNNMLAINYGSSANDPVAIIAGYLAGGYAGGNWVGTGINSRTAAAGSPGVTLSVGYSDGNTDSGTAAGANQILVKYTLAGDANLDGLVNFNDLVAVIQNFNKAGTDWAQGNFAYGASTNFNDLVAVVQNFNKTLSPAGSSDSSPGGGSTIALSRSAPIESTDVQLPEPASLGTLAIIASGLMRRRRRNKGNQINRRV